METPSIYEMQATLCQAMANPVRLEIVHRLMDGPSCVNELAEALSRPQATISRHLSILSRAGVVTGARQGQMVQYRLTNPKIADVCALMRQVLTEQALRQSEIMKGWEEQTSR